jgi:hypothetical protein
MEVPLKVSPSIPHALTSLELHFLAADSRLYCSAHGLLARVQYLPSHTDSKWLLLLVMMRHGLYRKCCVQQFFCCCIHKGGCGHVSFTEPLPSNGCVCRTLPCWLHNSDFQHTCHSFFQKEASYKTLVHDVYIFQWVLQPYVRPFCNEIWRKNGTYLCSHVYFSIIHSRYFDRIWSCHL